MFEVDQFLGSMSRANLATQTRKLPRVHQNVLVFVKGDPKRAAKWVKAT